MITSAQEVIVVTCYRIRNNNKEIPPGVRPICIAAIVIVWLVVLASSILTYKISHSWSTTGILIVVYFVFAIFLTHSFGFILGWWAIRWED